MQRRGYSVFQAIDLILKSLSGHLTSDEQQVLEHLKKETGLERCAGELFDRKALSEQLLKDPAFDTEEAYRQFMRKIAVKSPRRMFHRIRYAALWLLLLAVGGLTFWYMRDDREPEIPVAVIQPVGNRAVVTLADGSCVDLLAEDKDIAEKDGTVIQREAGCLVYAGNANAEKGQLLFNTLDVPRGGEYSLVLADGTKVNLNAETRLRFPVHFEGEKREVFLQGEAYFAVALDSTKPFIVHTSRGKVKVLGTSFNVRDYEDERQVVTTLVDGVVRYERQGDVGRYVVLKPGFQVADAENSVDLLVRKVRLQEYVGWKDG
ncbi:MAG: FecR domain-containing protein, partial [Odoribacter sp.]|nr:FecR domain-containing protein [Odoribacter sp.]